VGPIYRRAHEKWADAVTRLMGQLVLALRTKGELLFYFIFLFSYSFLFQIFHSKLDSNKIQFQTEL
jgi:hypothetical protein